MTHPLLDAGLELDCALRDLLHGGSASPRRAQRVREAAADIRAELLALSGEAAPPTTIADVQRVLEDARKSGVPWVEIVAVINHLQG